jgi:WD40 repeat protein
VTAAAFSADGKTIVSASSDNTLKLWDGATGREIRTLTGHGSYVTAAAFSPDGKTIVSGGCDVYETGKGCTRGVVKLWDVSEWTQPGGAMPSTAAPDSPLHRTGIPADAFRQGLEDGARLREQFGLDGGKPGSGNRFPSIIRNQ